MSHIKRLPDWLREDEAALTLNDETEEVKIKSYYDLLRQYVKTTTPTLGKYKKENTTITPGTSLKTPKQKLT
jgi:thioredoxin-related protein